MSHAPVRPTPFAVWTSRVALFSIGLVVATLVLHRLFWMSTAVALNLFAFAFMLAGLAILLALGAFASIWRTGGPGISRALLGLGISLVLLAWPASQWPAIANLPEINDVTTDPLSPPPFLSLAASRPPGSNSLTYPAERFAEAQLRAYPDIGPLILNRSVQDAYELVVDALQRGKVKMRIVNEQLPDQRAGQPGLIEAIDRTLILGFWDDVVFRISSDPRGARIDVRSASRFGRHDLGQNARRVRAILAELLTRAEATVASARRRSARPDREGGVIERPSARDERQRNLRR